MKDLLLDTHVWIWISIDDRRSLSRKARNMLDAPSGRKWISAISCWELAKLAERGRIVFSIPVLTWIRRSLLENKIQVAELSPEIAVESTQLAGFHRDPADQIIAATSRVLGMPLLTADANLLKFQGLEAIW
jgi:PIN domain nuclease of toxin-antitoxin system